MSEAHSKFDYDVNLFRPEPPGSENRIKDLFHGREKELKRGIEVLRKNMDIGGERYIRQEDKDPWIIHGESRSGKSHLARRILIELKGHSKQHQILIPTRERLLAKRAMRNLFERLSEYFWTCVHDETLEKKVSQHSLILDVSKLVEKVSHFLDDSIDSVSISINKSKKSDFKVGMSLGVPKLMSLVGGMGSQYGETNGKTVNLCRPSASDFATFSAIMVDTLLRFELTEHVLILFDDVDLLEAYESPTRNGRLERAALSDAIHILQNAPGIDVLLTARSWYAYSKKEFHTLVDLATSEAMTTQDLLVIHNKRFDTYGQNLPKAFLVKKALEQVAEGSDGKPGVFLQHLDTAFKRYQDAPDWEPRDYEWFIETFVQIYSNIRSKNPEAALLLEKSVSENLFDINVTQKNPFFNTLLQDEFVFPSYYGEDTYFTSSLGSEVVKRAVDRQQGQGDDIKNKD